MLTDDYTVRLDNFQGPLDLLLYLIRRAEVEITDIPIAEIADQYVEHLKGIERIDIDVAGDFLVVAATLMEIKSRLLTPGAGPGPGEGDEPGGGAESGDLDHADWVDPRAELVQQLLAYKKHRDAAESLAQRYDLWRRRHPAARAAAPRQALREAAQRRSEELDLEDLSVWDLASTYGRIAVAVNFDRLGDHRIELAADDTPIESHAADILDRLREAPDGQTLRALFEGRRRGQIVGLFIAALELTRRGAVAIEQRGPDEEIVLIIRDPDASTEALTSADAEALE